MASLVGKLLVRKIKPVKSASKLVKKPNSTKKKRPKPEIKQSNTAADVSSNKTSYSTSRPICIAKKYLGFFTIACIYTIWRRQ